jgi:nucleotide-binding universal stress UspA family protein
MARIAVGVDGSGGARAALAWAVEEARLRGAELDVVHAWHVPYVGSEAYAMVTIDQDALEEGARATLDEMLAEVDTEGVSITKRIVTGPASTALLEAGEGADLLVVGSRGRGGFAGLLLGSVSQQVIHHTNRPVVVVPARD